MDYEEEGKPEEFRCFGDGFPSNRFLQTGHWMGVPCLHRTTRWSCTSEGFALVSRHLAGKPAPTGTPILKVYIQEHFPQARRKTEDWRCTCGSWLASEEANKDYKASCSYNCRDARDTRQPVHPGHAQMSRKDSWSSYNLHRGGVFHKEHICTPHPTNDSGCLYASAPSSLNPLTVASRISAASWLQNTSITLPCSAIRLRNRSWLCRRAAPSVSIIRW